MNNEEYRARMGNAIGNIAARQPNASRDNLIQQIRFDHLHILEENSWVYNPGPEEQTKILALANSILNQGLRVPLRVYQEGEEYYILSGNRRYAAIDHLRKLRDEGADLNLPNPMDSDSRNVDLIGCIVQQKPKDQQELMAYIIQDNLQREKTAWSRMMEIVWMKEVLLNKPDFQVYNLLDSNALQDLDAAALEDDGLSDSEPAPAEAEESTPKRGRPGYRRELMNLLGVTNHQITQALSIHDRLIAPFMDLFRENRISVSVAYQLSTYPAQEQEKALELWDREKPLTQALVTSYLSDIAMQDLSDVESPKQEEVEPNEPEAETDADAEADADAESGTEEAETPSMPETLEESLQLITSTMQTIVQIPRTKTRPTAAARRQEASLRRRLTRELTKIHKLYEDVNQFYSRYGLETEE